MAQTLSKTAAKILVSTEATAWTASPTTAKVPTSIRAAATTASSTLQQTPESAVTPTAITFPIPEATLHFRAATVPTQSSTAATAFQSTRARATIPFRLTVRRAAIKQSRRATAVIPSESVNATKPKRNAITTESRSATATTTSTTATLRTQRLSRVAATTRLSPVAATITTLQSLRVQAITESPSTAQCTAAKFTLRAATIMFLSAAADIPIKFHSAAVTIRLLPIFGLRQSTSARATIS